MWPGGILGSRIIANPLTDESIRANGRAVAISDIWGGLSSLSEQPV